MGTDLLLCIKYSGVRPDAISQVHEPYWLARMDYGYLDVDKERDLVSVFLNWMIAGNMNSIQD